MIYALPEYMDIVNNTRKLIHDWDMLPEPIKQIPKTQVILQSTINALESNFLDRDEPPIVVTAILDYR